MLRSLIPDTRSRRETTARATVRQQRTANGSKVASDSTRELSRKRARLEVRFSWFEFVREGDSAWTDVRLFTFADV